MNARYYLPSIGKFASADTLIPDPQNPQSFNRYSYVRNNPVNRTDPTGHVDCNLLGDGGDTSGCETFKQDAFVQLVDFTAVETEVWANREKVTVQSGARKVAWALYRASGGQFTTPSEAFLAVYSGTVTFHKTGTSSDFGNLGEAKGSNLINVYNHSSKITDSNIGGMWAAHELGHAFNNALSPNATDKLTYGQGLISLALEGVTTVDGERFTGIPLGSSSYANYDIYERSIDKGYRGASGPYVQNDAPWPNEDFADMFSNWVYDNFAADKYGIARYNFMDSHMPSWIELAVTNNQ